MFITQTANLSKIVTFVALEHLLLANRLPGAEMGRELEKDTELQSTHKGVSVFNYSTLQCGAIVTSVFFKSNTA